MSHSYSRRKGAVNDRARWVMGMAARPDGVRCPEVAAALLVPQEYAAALLVRQVAAGRAIADKSAGHQRTVYRARDPQAWPLMPTPEVPVVKPRVRRSAGVAPTVTIHSRPNRAPAGETMVMPDGVVVQQCPHWTHDVRFQAAPGEPVFGAGFAAVGIGRDVTTGKGW